MKIKKKWNNHMIEWQKQKIKWNKDMIECRE